MAGEFKTGEILADSSNGNVTDLSKKYPEIKIYIFFLNSIMGKSEHKILEWS